MLYLYNKIPKHRLPQLLLLYLIGILIFVDCSTE